MAIIVHLLLCWFFNEIADKRLKDGDRETASMNDESGSIDQENKENGKG
jgi:hypothetical protein